ncbi:MAG: bifunctional DNA-binding transcriptional regulator/O6-methylguanine-DNA methyltransferase Ada [Anaerolineae bacterium]|nr:bifunctional DNA-binding transcriptional regulator/O6-methylguanine-DNA methyltransferase Ada [Anaerolineales bacterium]MCQ3973299.1 bifunctional DNA-binding transcriptional regulator/O6-methylguanine-DNA methyltransferase Ada [Anaerolineae bacterium]
MMNTIISEISEEIFWQACLNRDASFDGKFILAVRTTRIYCRPSCPARKPKRENVLFFKVPELAQQAGFRACKRCQPDAHIPYDPQLELVRAICRYIEQNAVEPLTLQTLSQCFNVSAWHLQRTFKEYVGISPLEYTEACRMDQLKQALRNGVPVTAAVYEAGFGSSSRVYEKAAPQLGMTPRRYQRNGDGTQIQFTVVPCALGQLLVATTERGVCAIKLGDDPVELERLLLSEFSAARIVRDDQAHKLWVRDIVNFIAGKEPHLDLPLDVRATAFQKQVWQALQRIPYGQTRTYADIAREIGQPKAVRAVANACGANPTALIVPCHRVVRSDGSMGGYHWGIERKRQLLLQEAIQLQPESEPQPEPML